MTIRLTNAKDNGPLGKTGYLIHLRVLETITANLKTLTSSLSVLEAAFANNETLLLKEKELRLGAEKQVEELQSKLWEREEADRAAAEKIWFEREREFEGKRQGLEEELEKARRELEDARKDGDYYDPSDPTQERAEGRIQWQVEEIKRVEGAIGDLESERERPAQVRNV